MSHWLCIVLTTLSARSHCEKSVDGSKTSSNTSYSICFFKLCMEESSKCRCMEKYEESQHPLIINKYTENKIPEKIAKLKNRRKEVLRESTVTELTNKFNFGSFEGTSKEYYEIKLRNEGLPTRESLYELYKYFCKERDKPVTDDAKYVTKYRYRNLLRIRYSVTDIFSSTS
ncbi:hypothetical protein ANN_00154 [Periplaneta americana]|uniref:Uncharacterized protein n=1 Tax=Periplaneta americana TaxID=6978 RepID=A0ABQ8TR31_PERAM|nr:hypothetical protein ANN_00154 [Periplaneta americana]